MLTEDDCQMPDKNQQLSVSAILAMDKNQLIGKGGSLPWHLPADLQHFKKMTLNHPIIMGRKTYLSIGKPLPGRTNIIVTHDITFEAAGCIVTHSPEEALSTANAKNEGEVFIIGGAEIYKVFMPYIQRFYITQIDHEFIGDTYFNNWKKNEWQEIEKTHYFPDEKNPYAYSFSIYERM